MPAETFVMPDSCGRASSTISCSPTACAPSIAAHLLGALTPLYLAWVASHIRLTSAGADPERHIEAVVAAFETDKPYLVSRWRWPDRFNP